MAEFFASWRGGSLLGAAAVLAFWMLWTAVGSAYDWWLWRGDTEGRLRSLEKWREGRS